ncbi:MAG: EAL domain-containing protein [Bacilli bacterium]|nr:EAL domain-containing protein [Bacilli bacterium]
MSNTNKQRNLQQAYALYTRIPALILGITLLFSIIFAVFYVVFKSIAFIIILAVVAGLSFIAYAIFYIVVSRRLKQTFYKQIYETTYKNINKINNNDTSLLSYGNSDIKEVQMLDKATEDLRKKLNSSFLVVSVPDYSKLNLDYVDKDKNLITYKSFRANLSNIIFVSQSFRNVLIEVYYELPADEKLKKEDKERILELYSKTFSDHEKVLFMFADDEKSLLIYVPVIDSFNEIKEKLGYAVSDSGITIRDDRGIQHIVAKYAVVAYPYSNEDMMLGDLRVAKRQGEPYCLFLPQRYRENINKELMLNTTMNTNYTQKVLVELNRLDYSSFDNEKNKNILKNIFNAIADFLNVDEGGIIVFDRANETYYPYVSARRNKLFIQGEVEKEFVTSLAAAADDDNSYYFSTKRHASGSIKRILDMYGINSGTYFAVHSTDGSYVSALIYMFNHTSDIKWDSYMREMFYVMAVRLENYFDKREISDYANSKIVENDNILALSRLYSYHIDDEYHVTEYSKSMKRKFPSLKLGDTCHKFFFNNDKPCKDCPLRTKQKKYFEDRGSKFESSLVLANRRDKDNVMLIKQLTDKDEVGDLFHPDLLIYSFRALVELLKNGYAAGARGYIVLLCIDNYEDIVAAKGSEGYSYFIREYARSIKNRLNTDDVYYYNPTTLAIHLPYEGHANTINKIESLYPLSKLNYFQNEAFKELKITYLPIGYPRGYANPENFLMHVSEFYNNPAFERGKDFIYFADYSISRSANKREFMVDVLEKEFSGHNSTSMYLQPIVSLKDGHIFGAEILLRIEDAHRNIFFNAMEISRIAQQEGKTELVTESIINFVGNMYKEYGKNVFKINKFNRIAINIDETYLGDNKVILDLINLCAENNLPKGFVSMEIPEEVIPNNKDKIKFLADELSKYEITFSCDRYLGQYVDIEELVHLGFKEVKVARDIVFAIDRDPVKYDAMRSIVNASKNFGISVAVVGVENADQARLLRELDDSILAQGYYYYKAISRTDLINTLISYEK